MVFPIIGERLVKGSILFAVDVRGVASPDRFGLVKLFFLLFELLDLLGLLLLLLFIIVNLWRVSQLETTIICEKKTNLFNLWLLVITILNLGLLFIIIGNFPLNLLGNMEVNWVGNEFRMLLDDLLDLGFLQVLLQTVLDVKDNLSTTANARSVCIVFDGERTTGGGLPDVLL